MLLQLSQALHEARLRLDHVLPHRPEPARLPHHGDAGLARSIIRFMVSVIPDPDHEDTADTLEALRDARLA
ncbi:hypothetical protein [Streptomyces rubrogriseus]|uniref:hypothetical protein n=1 Tax=Streptomyces rubrogriseus TaxID=194673 RepID=UPI00139258F9|nr:hypothetical protein [Streptomyces sp. SID5926]